MKIKCIIELQIDIYCQLDYYSIIENTLNLLLSTIKGKTMSKEYTVTVEEDSLTKELVLPFPPELINELKWEINDTLDFQAQGSGFVIKNLSLEERNSEEKIFIIETISTFKITYAIKGKSLEHAMDTVTMEEADEINQEFLGETILGGREISKKDLLEKELNFPYMNAHPEIWTEEKKMSKVFKIKYDK